MPQWRAKLSMASKNAPREGNYQYCNQKVAAERGLWANSFINMWPWTQAQGASSQRSALTLVLRGFVWPILLLILWKTTSLLPLCSQACLWSGKRCHGCSSLLPIAVIRTMTTSNLERKGFFWLIYPGEVHHQRKSGWALKTETWRQGWNRDHGGKRLTG